MKKETDNCKHCNIHEHTHVHEEREELKKKDVILYIISAFLFILSFIPVIKPYQLWLCFISVIMSGYNLILEGIKNVFKLNFEEDTLMAIATIAAFILGEYPESCMIILLFKLGEFLEDKASENSYKNIKKIVEIKARTANIIEENETIKTTDVENVRVGDTILIKPGEMVPLDSQIITGTSTLDMSSLTGESLPIEVTTNQNILSGSINLNRNSKM